ncbi:hypothetical protein [Paraburkholderia sp. DHOC27]|uniref:hypothetical protein n=1 Tax=Paraburkholderia sp. DHOC27 TaxID=2303330 RepID=UPI000E3E3AF6|nr:hypothetical protein [Paraburkholderia sp. DHOC27]RFU48835.1 hypothetical protein D0B32_03100 [Paraburkholderia sp. DHOC27]
MNAREIADSMTALRIDALAAEPRWIHSDIPPSNALSERMFKILVVAVCGWSLLETPLELGGADAQVGLLALLVSKLVMLAAGLAAVANLRFARGTFAFICGASVLAIAPALPLEYKQSFAIATVSTVECLVKAACVVAYGFVSSRTRRSHQQ